MAKTLSHILASLCVIHAAYSTFIIGGRNAGVGEFKMMAGIYRNGLFVCGGSLINKRYVLTAKHCVTSSASSYRVKLGDHDRTRSDGEKTYRVSSIKKHPGRTTDLALLYLRSDVRSTSRISPVSLASREPTEGQAVMAVGWGWTRHQDSRSLATVLQKLVLPMRTDAQCVADGLGWITGGPHLCVGFRTGSYVNVCHGDSGSPLLFRSSSSRPWTQIGVVKGGHGGCSSRYHMAVFTSVPNTRSWLVSNSRIPRIIVPVYAITSDKPIPTSQRRLM